MKAPCSIAAAVALSACTMSPTNGTTASGSVVGKTFNFEGFYHEPNKQLRLEVLKDPTFNPSTASNWSLVTTMTSSNDPFDVNDPANPLFYWSVTAAPVPNAAAAARWPQGGLVRLRARDPNPTQGDGVLTTFDSVTFSRCLDEHLADGASWEAIGTACVGTGNKVASFVSTSNVPDNGAVGFLGRKTDISTTETGQYYNTINAPDTLAQFRTTYGFTGSEIKATFYNDGDLGLGREMHCKAFAGAGGTGIACYVTNYSGIAGQAVFNQNPTTILADAVAHQNSFATVAMVYDPPFGAANSVKFMVYDADGDLSPTAKLDSTGDHQSVPKNCMACHGINSTYDATANAVTGAQFLPFDPFSYKYSTQAGFTFADQATELRQLNGLVTLTAPAPAIASFISGLYAPKLVTDPTAVANDDFVPSGWANAYTGLDGTAVYRGVVKVGCRTCHMSATNPSLDFADAADFDANKAIILADVCGAHVMPHAERVMKRFWQSGARAYLTSMYKNGFYPDPAMACAP